MTDSFPLSDYSKHKMSNCFLFFWGGGSIHGIVMVLYDVRESHSSGYKYKSHTYMLFKISAYEGQPVRMNSRATLKAQHKIS